MDDILQDEVRGVLVVCDLIMPFGFKTMQSIIKKHGYTFYVGIRQVKNGRLY